MSGRDTTFFDMVVLMLCTLPYVVFAGAIALLLGQPSISATMWLWASMVVLILVLLGAIAVWRLRNRRHRGNSS
jgi:membrane protein implicated in regulation of membrane protease activity